MTPPFRVRLLKEARDDLRRLEDFLIERELASESPDWDVAERALAAIRDAMRFLAWSPFSCRKAQPAQGRLRELVIPFGSAGYIALFEIVADEVVVAAFRHQREHDYRP